MCGGIIALLAAPLAFVLPIVPRPRPLLRSAHLICTSEAPFDINAAITALNAAVAAEDYAEAARLKALIAEAAPAAAGSATWPDSSENGVTALPTWLRERFEALGFRYPTPIQSAALRTKTRDAVLRAPTGAGKTTAYLAPLVAKVAAALEKRSAQVIEAVAQFDLSPTDALGALAPALSTGVPLSDPFGSINGGGTLLGGIPLRGPPLALVIVPRDSLAEQVAGTAYSILGGYARASRTWKPGASDSLFKYKGPKGARVCILRADTDEATLRRASEDCDVLVATPGGLRAFLDAESSWREAADARNVLTSLAAIAIDEADACLEDDAPILLRPDWIEKLPVSCARLLVGATIADELVETAVAANLLRPPQVCDGEGGVSGCEEDGEGKGGGVGAAISVPASVVHRAMVADSDGIQLPLLARLMRSDLREWQQQQQQEEEEEEENEEVEATEKGEAEEAGSTRPRCVVFVTSEEAASAVSATLRSALWGDHAVAVLLPSTGQNPSLVLGNFRRAVGSTGATGAGGGMGGDFATMAMAQGASVPEPGPVDLGLLSSHVRSFTPPPPLPPHQRVPLLRS